MKMTLQAVTRLNIHDFKHVIAWHWLSPGSLSVTMVVVRLDPIPCVMNEVT